MQSLCSRKFFTLSACPLFTLFHPHRLVCPPALWLSSWRRRPLLLWFAHHQHPIAQLLPKGRPDQPHSPSICDELYSTRVRCEFSSFSHCSHFRKRAFINFRPTKIYLLYISNPNETPSTTSYVDTYAYDYIEPPVESSHQHMKILGESSSSDSNHRRKRQSSNSHRKTNKRSHSGSQPTDDSEEFDNGDVYDLAEKPLSAIDTIKAKQQRPEESSIWRKPFWDTYDSINQLYLEIGMV